MRPTGVGRASGSGDSMHMPVVNIRVMWVRVREGQVRVVVTMWAAAMTFRIMRVLVVRIMHVFVRMLQVFMQVFMGMVLGEVQPYTQAHQGRSNPERQRCRFRENYQSHCSANEGGG